MDGQEKMNPDERERRIVVRAGLFVGLGLALAGIVIFLVGKERMFFDKQNRYVGAFENVDGLTLDAPVRLGGLNAGRVTDIKFEDNLEDKRIVVTMEVAKKFEKRIRKDSVARITGRGVLGDKAVDVSLGSPNEPQIPNGGELATGTSGDISSLLKATGEIIDNAVGITRDLRQGVTAYTSPEMRADVAALLHSTRSIVEEIEQGKGALHTAVYDKQSGEQLKELLANASSAAKRLDGSATEVQQLLADIRTGDGAMHAIIYDKKTAKAVTELGDAAEQLAQVIEDAKTHKDGAVYQLVYGDSKQMIGDLSSAAADIKAITTKVKSGEGSLGGIIYDPTVYEDLKEVLGNVKRNKVLRELVRFSISNGENLDSTGKPVQTQSKQK